MEKSSWVRSRVRENLIPSFVLYIRLERRALKRKQEKIHADKLQSLSLAQDRPLLSVSNTVLTHNLKSPLPKFVLETLSLGPKAAVLDKINPKNVLAELDLLLEFCKSHDVTDQMITDINVKTLAYIKKCQKQKSPRNIDMTKRYLKDNGLVAIPFDKGVGISVMEKDTYFKKLDAITSLPQFEKVTPKRKNEKHPVLKEEEDIVNVLKSLKANGEIDDVLFSKLKPRGSQPPRLYGLAKVHKPDVPMRPVLSMPGSAYFKIAKQVTDWLSVVDECKIQSSTQSISESLKSVELEEDEVIVSFDVTSLYTNVPVHEAIDICTELLFSGKYQLPPVNKNTFKTLLTISSSNVLMLAHDGYYRQRDGLAMGIPPAPPLANGWLSQYDPRIKGDAKLFSRYMDDIIRSILKDRIESKLLEINSIHTSLKFTIEKEQNASLPFLDMKIIRENGRLESTWYTKPTDTGLVMNFHSLAPMKYKRSVVTGFVHRIFRSCSTWTNFQESMDRAKQILDKNQYPRSFYDPLIRDTISKLVAPQNQETDTTLAAEDPKHLMFLQYRGRITEEFQRTLKHLEVPCVVVSTMRKLRSVLPPLKPAVEKSLKSRVVYKITCSRCSSCYVGQTDRHVSTRFKEHIQPSKPIGKHIRLCGVQLNFADKEAVSILQATNRSIPFLEALEALWQRDLKPQLNTRDEYRKRELTIKL